MSDSIKTYFLAPNWDFLPPPQGYFFLGSIIVDPKKPQRSLNAGERHPVENVQTSYKDEWSLAHGDLVSGSAGIFASFLQLIVGVGADVEFSKSRDKNVVYRCNRLETHSFEPDDAYLQRCLQDERVKDFANNAGPLRKTMYMITGIKIARGPSAESHEASSVGSDVSLTADGTVLGAGTVPISGGPKLKFERRKSEATSWGASSDFVFAYQLVKLRPKRNGRVEVRDYRTRAAAYSLSMDDPEEIIINDDDGGAEQMRMAWGIADVDWIRDGIENIAVKRVIDEDGEECSVVVDIQ